MIETDFPLNALDTPIHQPGFRSSRLARALMSLLAAVAFVGAVSPLAALRK